MSNHNKIRPVDKNNLNGKYKIVFSTPQNKNSKIPLKFRGLQVFNNKQEAELALKQRLELTEVLKEKNKKLMEGNQRALGNSGGNPENLIIGTLKIEGFSDTKYISIDRNNSEVRIGSYVINLKNEKVFTENSRVNCIKDLD